MREKERECERESKRERETEREREKERALVNEPGQSSRTTAAGFENFSR